MTIERHEELTDEELAAVTGGCHRGRMKTRDAPMATRTSAEFESNNVTKTLTVTVNVERIVT